MVSVVSKFRQHLPCTERFQNLQKKHGTKANNHIYTKYGTKANNHIYIPNMGTKANIHQYIKSSHVL